MKASTFECEHCGSRNLRRSQRKSFAEYAGSLLGRYPVRCTVCGQRSSLNILLLSKFFVAKCPKCLQMRLSTWDTKHYRIPRWKKVLMTLGAHRYRCNACRYNFVSFRGQAAADVAGRSER